MVFLFQNEENTSRRRQNPALMAPITTRKTYHLKDEALYLTSVLRAGLEESALNADSRGLLSRALAKGELNQFLVDFFSEPSNLMFARGKVEERRRKMAHFSALEPVVPENHTARRHAGDSMDRRGAFSHDQMDHSRFVETATGDRSGDLPMEGTSAQGASHDDETSSCSRALSGLKGEASQGLCSSKREDSVKSCVSLLSVNSESTLGTTDASSFASRHGAINGDEKNLRRRGERRHDRHGKPMTDRTRDVRRRIENFHFEGHLLHRACGVTGNGSDDSQSECSLLEDSGEDQLSKLRRNPVIMDILVRLKTLSLSLVHPRGSLGVETVSGSTTRGKEKVEGGRPGGVDALCLAQEGYVGLFEEMLSEILRMQRNKSKVLRVENGALRRELERCRKTEIRAKAEADAYELQLEVLSTSKKALEIQVAAHDVQLKAMSEEIESHAREDRLARQRKEDVGSANKRKALVEALKEEEHTLRRRFNEMEAVAERAEVGARSVRHLQAKMDRTADIKHRINVAEKLKEVSARRSGFKHSAEAFTQTVADDDGLWDRQDGLTKDVSGSTLRRLRWQAVRRFASCPSCRGMGARSRDKMVKGKWKHVQDLLFKDDPKSLYQRSNKKKPKSVKALDRSWSMPDQLVDFMSHLPKTAQALPIKSLRWLIREIWAILDERERADAIDAHEGQHVQSMNDFVLELFLRRHLLRQDAEMKLYIFLASLKAHYKKSTGAHTFARMMDLLEDVEFSKGKQSKAGDGKESVTPNNAHIGTAFLPVVLFTRRALLKRPPMDVGLIRREKELNRFDGGADLATPLIDTPPAHSQPSDEAIPGEGQPPSDFSTDKLQDSKDQRQHSNGNLHGKGKETSEASREGEVQPIDLPPHVYTQAYCTFWVTLDTAVRALTIVLHWCPPMKRHAYMRVLEKDASILSSKENNRFTEGQACHSFIRSVMRKTIASVEFELDGGKYGSTADTGTPGRAGGIIQGRGCSGNEKTVMTEHDAPGNARVVIDIDKVVQLVVEVLLQRQSSIEQSLKTLFAEGDENGDGVLTFDEFSNIVTRAAPHFSERRILRMFREALTTGSEDSYAIEKETFCKVCRQHGLVQLIDIETLEKMASSSRGRLCISKPSPPPSAARLLPPTVTSPTVTPPTVIPPTVRPPTVTPPTVTYPTVTPPRVPPQSITLPAITLPPVEGWPDGRRQSERRRLTYF